MARLKDREESTEVDERPGGVNVRGKWTVLVWTGDEWLVDSRHSKRHGAVDKALYLSVKKNGGSLTLASGELDKLEDAIDKGERYTPKQSYRFSTAVLDPKGNTVTLRGWERGE